MKISARLQNSLDNHQVTLTTDGRSQSLQIPPKSTGFGSSTNGGEFFSLLELPAAPWKPRACKRFCLG
jgi:hypothetical protein